MPDELVELVELINRGELLDRGELVGLLNEGELVGVPGVLAARENKFTGIQLRSVTGVRGLLPGEALSASESLDPKEADCLPLELPLFELTLFAIPIPLHMDTTGAPSA